MRAAQTMSVKHKKADANVAADAYELAVREFYEAAAALAAQAKPGDALHNVTHDELVSAIHDVLAMLPRLRWPFAVAEPIRVGGPAS